MTDTAQDQTDVVPPLVPRAAPLPLDYAHRLPPRWPRLHALWRGLINLGPVFPGPSIRTIVLLLLCIGASWWLANRPESWRWVKSYVMPRVYSDFPVYCYLPRREAIACANGHGGLKIWRPWSGEILLDTETPPSLLPPHPAPGTDGDAWWVIASQDESTLLARSHKGACLWDVRTGRLIIPHARKRLVCGMHLAGRSLVRFVREKNAGRGIAAAGIARKWEGERRGTRPGVSCPGEPASDTRQAAPHGRRCPLRFA